MVLPWPRLGVCQGGGGAGATRTAGESGLAGRTCACDRRRGRGRRSRRPRGLRGPRRQGNRVHPDDDDRSGAGAADARSVARPGAEAPPAGATARLAASASPVTAARAGARLAASGPGRNAAAGRDAAARARPGLASSTPGRAPARGEAEAPSRAPPRAPGRRACSGQPRLGRAGPTRGEHCLHARRLLLDSGGDHGGHGHFRPLAGTSLLPRGRGPGPPARAGRSPAGTRSATRARARGRRRPPDRPRPRRRLDRGDRRHALPARRLAPRPREGLVLVDARSLAAGARLEADVCVVGAGPAGLAVISELDGRGPSVVVLAGSAEAAPGEVSGDSYPALADTRAGDVGGTAALWDAELSPGSFGARYAPLAPIDFEERDGIPGSGWPFDRSELDPFYARAHDLCVAGPYDYEPADAEALLSVDGVATGLFRLGLAEPFTQAQRDRLAQSDAVRVLTDATVTRIGTAEGGGAVSHVEAGPGAGEEVSPSAPVPPPPPP